MRWYAMIFGVLVVALGVPTGLLVGPGRPGSLPPPLPEVAAWRAEPVRPPDPVRATPAQVAAYFQAEPASVGAQLTRRYPRIVGNLDGAPLALRYAATRALTGRANLLAYDPRGDGRVVAVVGDLETADRVVVLIPGVDTTLANFDTGLGGVARRAPAWQAVQLAAAIQRSAPAARVAVLAWLGYDPPEGVRRAALREERARAGALALQRFLAGLAAVRPGASVVLVGHSYGSVVAGLAAPHFGPAVTDLVALGSPGMGGAATVADLHTTARVWVGSAAGDWTRFIPGAQLLGVGHGRLPSNPRFGALPLPVAGVRDHDGYFEPGSSTLAALAAIAAGLPVSGAVAVAAGVH